MKTIKNKVDTRLFDKIIRQREKNFPELESPNFPDILQPNIKSYLEKSALSIGVNYDSLAMALLGNISIAIGGNKIIKLSEGWTEKANLWIALIGKSGVGKTPILEAAGKTVLDKISENGKRFFTTNATVESICNLHKDNTTGIGVLNDELSIFLDGKGQYKQGSGNDQAFYVQTWNSKGTNFNDTVKGTRFIKSPYIPIIGGIQPDILQKIINDKNNKDGFASRFLYIFIESQYLSNIDKNEYSESISEEERRIFYSLIENLIQNRDTEEIYSFSEKTKKDLLLYHDELDREALINDELLYSSFRKLKTYSLRLSLIIHLISGNKSSVISEGTIEKTISLTNYFKQNIRKAYDCAYQTKEEIQESKIIEKLKDFHKAGNPFIEKDRLKQCLKKSIKFPVQEKIISKLVKENIICYTENNRKYISLKIR